MSGPTGSEQWMYSSSTEFYTHTIDQSLRLNRADSAHLSKTWGSAADSNQIFTFSIWVKRHGEGDGSNDLVLIQSKNTGGGTGQGSTLLGFYRDSNLLYYTENGGRNARSKALYRDCGSWMHLCWQYDSTQSTAEDRIKIYVNGVHIVAGSTNWTSAGFGFPEVPALNSVMTSMNQNTQLNAIGAGISTSINYGYFDGYIAEVIMLDGVSTDCTSFGEFKDGIWIPKAYSGSFGANGYHLDFADSSAIGNDVSGNNNDWTANNLAATDVVPDSPTNNFATLNSIYHSSSQAVLSEGNLKADTAGFVNAADGYGAVSTFAIPKDKKIYIEVECTDGTGDNWFAGFAAQSGLESGPSSTSVGGSNAITVYNRQVYINGSENDYGSGSSLGGLGDPRLQSGDILGCAIDGATGKVWFSQNGTYFGKPLGHNSGAGATGDPAAGTNEIGTITNGTTEDVFFVIGGNTSVSSIFVNFGQDSVNVASAQSDANGIGTFEYAPPTDYLALCASNLSDPTIGPGQSTQADDHFNIVLYTGDSDNDVTVTNTFAADFVWLKKRSASDNHYLQDIVRGFGASKSLSSNTTGTEGYNGGAPSSQNIVTTDSSLRLVSSDFADNSATYVAWTWKAGGSGNTFNVDGTGYGSASDASLSGGNVTPTAASINTTAGFSIIGYTGNGSANQTIKHGLSSAPEFIIIKDRDANSNNDQWQIIHTAAGDDYGYFTTDTFAGTGQMIPTSGDATTVTIGRDSTVLTNESGDDFIMYCFHSVEGYSKFGSYEGNSSADGTYVHLNFRPKYVMLKNIDTAWNWNIHDTVRDTANVDATSLWADSSAAENGVGNASDWQVDMLSNGFKLRENTNYINQTSKTVIYIAFAEAPFKFANAK